MAAANEARIKAQAMGEGMLDNAMSAVGDLKGKTRRVDPDFGSSLTASSVNSQSHCWVNWKSMGQPCEFQVPAGSPKAAAEAKEPRKVRATVAVMPTTHDCSIAPPHGATARGPCAPMLMTFVRPPRQSLRCQWPPQAGRHV